MAVFFLHGGHHQKAHGQVSGVVFKITCSRTGAVPIQRYSYFPNEAELLFSANSRFRVTGHYKYSDYNLRYGTGQGQSVPGSSHIYMQDYAPVHLDLLEAKREPVVIIALMEVAGD